MSNVVSPRKPSTPSGTGAVIISVLTRQENEKAFRAILHDHLQGPVETLITHYLYVSPTHPEDQALSTRTALLQERGVLDAVEELRRIDMQYRNAQKRGELAMYAPLVRISCSVPLKLLNLRNKRRF